MNLSHDKIDFYLRKIFSCVDIADVNGTILVFKQPSNFVRLRASYIYQQAYDRACSEGILPREAIEKLLDSRNIITEKDKLKLSSLESKLAAQKVLLSKTVKVKANQDRIKKLIEELKEEIFAIKYKKSSKLMLSAESMAEDRRYDFFCAHCTYKEDGSSLYWGDFSSFMGETDLVFKQMVLNKFSVFFNGIPTDIIRNIARSNLWRIRYVNSIKTSESLFGMATSDYTDDMLNLVFWSNYYQNIYEMLPDDRPSDSLIEDDVALDAYMSSYHEEKERDFKTRRQKNRTGGKLSAFDSEEVIVTRFNELYEDIKYDKPREAKRSKESADFKRKTNSKK